MLLPRECPEHFIQTALFCWKIYKDIFLYVVNLERSAQWWSASVYWYWPWVLGISFYRIMVKSQRDRRGVAGSIPNIHHGKSAKQRNGSDARLLLFHYSCWLSNPQLRRRGKRLLAAATGAHLLFIRFRWLSFTPSRSGWPADREAEVVSIYSQST